MARRTRHQNLNHPQCEPEKVPLEVECSVFFDGEPRVPVKKLTQWLLSLPEDAVVRHDFIRAGKIYLTASWTETLPPEE